MTKKLFVIWYIEKLIMFMNTHSNLLLVSLFVLFGLDIQVNMFKISMKVNFPPTMEPPFSINLLTHLWRTFFISSLLKNHNLDFLKLVWNCHNAQVLIFAKDTKTFSTFLKVNYLWFSGHML